jgi:fermentation-respiration switch protein FrsA (DUF1100 family)
MIKILIGAVVVYAFYCGALFLLQRQMLYPRYLMGASGHSGSVPKGVEPLRIGTPEGTIEAWYLPPVGGGTPAPAMIFAHGNAETIDGLVPEFRPIAALGMGVLLVEYPGYGRSKGSPSQASITAAMVAAYDHLAARPEVDPSRIVLYGRSLGGGAACVLAARRPSAGLILISTFTSVRSFARRYGVPGVLVRDPFDNLAVIRSYRRPILIIHGLHDEVISYSHAKNLYRAAPDGQLITYECGHNDCPPDPHQFVRDLQFFLVETGVLSKAPARFAQ